MEFKDLQGKQNEKVMSRYIKQLQLLCLQFGIHPIELELTLKGIFAIIGNAGNDRVSIYRTALQVLNEHPSAVTGAERSKDEKKLFLYEEDEKFHLTIMHMPLDLKVPYILIEFHGLSISETADVSGLKEEQIHKSMHGAEKFIQTELQIEPEQFKRALRFMKKTYSRLPLLTDLEQLFSVGLDKDRFYEIKVDQKDQLILTKQMIGATFAVILFISIFFISSTTNRVVDEQYLENLQEEFQAVMDERRGQLGLNQTMFGQLSHVANARSLYSMFQSEMSQSINSEDPMKRKAAREKFDEVIKSFRLPSEMVEELKEQPLTEDLDASLKFLDEYAEQLHLIRRAYITEIKPYEASELSNTIEKAMERQNLYYDKPSYTVQYKESGITKSLERSLHPSAKPYIDLLVIEPAYYSIELLGVKELLSNVAMLEEIVLNDTRNSYLHELAKSLYYRTLSQLTHAPSVYRKDTTIKEEYMDAWNNLAEDKENSPIGMIFSHILSGLDTFDLNGTKLLSEIDLNFELDRAITHALEGNLDTYSVVERSFQGLDRYASIDLPHEEYKQNVAELLDMIDRNMSTKDFSYMMIENLLTVVGVYDAAQREEKWNVLWHIGLKYLSFEQFKDSYTMGEPILDGVDSIVFDPQYVQNRNAPILFVKEGKTEIGVWLVQNGQGWIVEKVAE